uniref:Titin n=1 Tax=Sinocyclocheilus rhinocerous TaxID=307959 RepID=A0A673JCH7_9TELE
MYSFGDPCETAEPVKATETPGPVKDLSMKDSTNTSVTLQWNKPDYDGGSIITDYIIEKKLQGQEEWAPAGTNKHCEHEVTKLKELTEMFFRVCSKNEKGTSDFVEIGSIKVKDYIIPPEANLKEYPDGQISVRLGHNAHIELPYKGKPRPAILWLKDNLPLKESEKIRFKKTENKATLVIKNVEKENGGKYTLTLDNTFFRKSFHIQVITLGPPAKPVGPIRLDEVRAESIAISWDEPNDNGGGEITCYTVEKRDTSQTDWKMACSNVIGTSFKVPNLIKGIQYQFRVCAENRYGASEPLVSQNVIAKHEFRPPGPPGMPLVYNVTNDGMTIQWDAPIFDGGCPILGFHVEKKEKNSIMWQKVNLVLVKEREYRILGLIEGLEYQFRVYAQNDAGYSRMSDTFKVLDTPGVPGALSIKEVTRGALTIAWKPPTNDGGARVHHYIVEKREARRRTWTEAAPKTTQTSLRVSDLLEGVPYFFRVVAENQYGLGEAYEMPDPVIATAEPAPPKRIDIIDTTDTSATLVWLKPEHDGGSRITGYCVESKAKDADKWIVCGTTKYLSLVIEGLIENSEYEFRVKAKNDSGFSMPREAFSSVIIKEPRIEPTADLSGITNQLITSRIGESFEIDVPISGRPAPKVSWKLEEMRLKETDRVSIKTTKNRTTLTVKDCMRGDGGRYFLTLENVTGSKTFTVTVNVIGRPSPPEGPIEISSITSESCVLSWNLPEDDGGTDITNYIVEKRESGSTAWQLINSKVTNVSRSTVSIKWSVPLNDGGSPITGYIVERKPYTVTGDGRWLKCNYTNVTNTNFTITALGEGEEYEFRVIAKNANGVLSLPSVSTGPVTCKAEYSMYHTWFFN